MTSPTADPGAARAHARAQAGTRVEAMPILPASAAADRPNGVKAGDMLWEETIAAGGYASARLDRGARLRLIDLYGDASPSMLIFNTDQPAERLNVADTIKIQWNAYLGAGKLLLSDMGRVLMSILADSAESHDVFCGASNEKTNARKYGDGSNSGPHPNARDRFLLAAAKWGLDRRDVHPCVNFFKPVRIGDDGATQFDPGPFEPGREIVLRAEMNVLVIIANCPHVLDPRAAYTVTPLRVTAWRGAVTEQGDAIRLATPEGLRAYENVEAYFSQ
ncbi:MAG TPA: urea amidolyase associated protein UAAP1 [Caulobacterales bacterium]|nr:urea amidolyase associated protein UAAP1 [Caulobacterales bacterium]